MTATTSASKGSKVEDEAKIARLRREAAAIKPWSAALEILRATADTTSRLLENSARRASKDGDDAIALSARFTTAPDAAQEQNDTSWRQRVSPIPFVAKVQMYRENA